MAQLGSTKVFGDLAVTGMINNSSLPVFYAYSTGSNIVTTASTVVFNSTIVNNGNHYNTSNGAFTAPISGYYEFNAVLLYRNTTSGNGEYTFRKNGVNMAVRNTAYVSINVTSGHTPCSSMIRTYLNAGDYVQVYVSVLNGSDFYCGENLSFFTGRLIG